MTNASSVLSEAEGRAAILKEADTWVLTPYHHDACVKGGGVDCLKFVHAVYQAVGLVPQRTFPYYGHQEHHNEVENYLNGVLEYAHEVEVPKPGDVVLYRIIKVFRHGGIIDAAGWPSIIHASFEGRCVMHDDGTGGRLGNKEHKFFSYW